MSGEWGLPYRPPCPGVTWPARVALDLFGCYNHRRAAHEATVASVTVDDGGTGYTTAAITFDPDNEARATAVIVAGVITEITVTHGGHDYGTPPAVIITGANTTPASATAVVAGVPLYPNTQEGITPPTVLTECVGGTLVEGNCYQLDEVNVGDFSLCRKIGWKGLVAVKAWHGRVGFDQAQSPVTAAIPHKYQQIEVEIVASGRGWNMVPGSPPVLWEWAGDGMATSTWIVNQSSGVITESNRAFSATPGSPNSSEYVGLCGGYSDLDDAIRFLSSMRHSAAGVSYQGTNLWGIPTGTWNDVVAGWEAYGGVTHTVTETQTDDELELLIEYASADPEPNKEEAEPGDYYVEESIYIHILLSAKVTAKEFCAVPFSLLSNWNLADDVQYPWRTDGNCTGLPMVKFKEYQTARDPDLGLVSDTDFLDDNRPGFGADYTGAVTGNPLPNGCGPHYSFELVEWNPGGGIPDTATYWEQDFSNFATLMDQSAGGAIMWEGATGVAFVQIWAEINDGYPSYNFFRPCGADRLTVNKDDAAYTAEYGGAVSYCDSKADPETYPPLLLFPDAWPICGRLAVVSAVQDGASVNITLSSPAEYLDPGDLVDFVEYDEAFAETIDDGDLKSVPDSAGYEVTAVADSTHFTITAASVPTALQTQWDYVKSHGAPHYQWDDDKSKADYVFMSYDYDMTATPSPTYTPTCYAGCLPRSACCPSVMAVTPVETQTWCNGYKHWPANADMKLMIGQNWYWQGIGISHMPDPLFEPPDPICDDPEAAPNVEARCDAPVGSPAAPSGYSYDFPASGWFAAPNPGGCHHGDEWV